MPKDFDPKVVIEFGKEPGLNIRKLQEQGYTGRGVNMAYVDQPLLEGHVAYENVNIEDYKIRPEEPSMDTSMHGPAVLSLLAGDDIGIAPNANVYFFGHPSWLMDQRTHADALYKLIEINKTLAEDEKVRIVGFSDALDSREKYINDYKKAIIEPLKDNDNYLNYEVAQWMKSNESNITNRFYVPTSGRTVATGIGNTLNRYDYCTNGRLSWGVPYVVGTIALVASSGEQPSPSQRYRVPPDFCRNLR